VELRKLLRHKDENVLKVAAFILSELGERAKPLLDEVPLLLQNSIPLIRFHAIEAVQAASVGNEDEGQMIAYAILLLDDRVPLVRRKAFEFLLDASDIQIQSALRYLENAKPSSLCIIYLRWLLSPMAHNGLDVIVRLNDPNLLVRKYAIIAARRMVVEDSSPLQFARSSTDLELRYLSELADQSIRTVSLIKSRGLT
jgi:hypothetical protein